MIYCYEMATVTNQDVLKLARLARIELQPEEVEGFGAEINKILAYVEKLQAVDVAGLEPTIQVTGLSNVVREDVVKQYQAAPQDLLETAPSRDGTLIKVKRVLK